MLQCNKCGKAMETSDGTQIPGIRFSYHKSPKDKELAKLCRTLWGKYLPEGVDVIEYNFCVECWIDSLMGVK